ncbi:MAG: metal ABC transporter ATP-binding protein [Solobacterium sp.]|nr:metal ABC transporter ATP-binding protein [Solobacterium sp.]
MALITCENVSLGYEGTAIVENLNFTVNKNDYLCIIGENGSGKTTLMKSMLGLMKPMSGKILFSDGLKQNEIGYLPQQTMVQKDFPASAYEVVLSGCINHLGFHMHYAKKEKKKVISAMKKLNIWDLKDKSYRTLSGGQQQRVLLARALCATETLLVLDEPVTGLDFETTKQMYQLIDSLHKSGITIIMISHDPEATRKYATKILFLDHEIAFCDADEYFGRKS